MTPPIDSIATQTIATIAFGIIATLIGAIAIWQGRRAWSRLHSQQRGRYAESEAESQTSEAVELEARRPIFELPTSPSPRNSSPTPATSSTSEEARLLEPFPVSAPIIPPAAITPLPA